MRAKGSGSFITLLLALAVGSTASALASAGKQARPSQPSVDAAYFDREVQPILQRACVGCHGEKVQLSHLDLRSRASVLKGGSRGPALAPGSAAKSHLFQLVSGA